MFLFSCIVFERLRESKISPGDGVTQHNLAPFFRMCHLVPSLPLIAYRGLPGPAEGLPGLPAPIRGLPEPTKAYQRPTEAYKPPPHPSRKFAFSMFYRIVLWYTSCVAPCIGTDRQIVIGGGRRRRRKRRSSLPAATGAASTTRCRVVCI